ncbi:outer membrane beta-barrel protein [Mucilaginibacter sp. CSA2-8R]|uniref:outer membrane beta-barrel protein n=1 Tax=Mucilaginibacter sp. CSA2-8R TaxID=3141542 RepID=UPI00315D9901
MIKQLQILLLLLICYSSGFSQNFSQELIVKAVNVKNQEIVDNRLISVSLLNVKDSTFVQQLRWTERSNVSLKGIRDGKYILFYQAEGFIPRYEDIMVRNGQVAEELHVINFIPKQISLGEVVVKGARTNIAVKGDTTDYNALGYVTQVNDNVEALLKKLPGIDISRDGKITVQGKTVNKVLVDGKEFFGNDPKAAIKNLPADAIAKVQVIDDKTDRTKNTGIDDGQREKVINLSLKNDKKNGWFGNIAAQPGTGSRYLAQANLNKFNERSQLSVISLSNNINETGFSLEDLNNFTNGSTYSFFGSGNGTLNFSVSNSGRVNVNNAFSGLDGGLVKSHNGGINFSAQYGKRKQLKFNISVMGLLSSNDITQKTEINDIPNNLLTSQLNQGSNSNDLYRINLNFDYTIDTLTSFRFKPFFTNGQKRSNSVLLSTTTREDLSFVNNIRQFLEQASTSPSVGGQIGINKKLRYGQGSINFFTYGSYSDNKLNYTNDLLINAVSASNPTGGNVQQQTSQGNNGGFFTSTLSYIKPLSKKRKVNLTLSQIVDFRKETASQYTLDYNPLNGNYEIYNANFSGNITSTNYRYTTTAGINKVSDEVTLNANLAVARLGLRGEIQNSVSEGVDREIWAFVPNISGLFRPKKGTSLYIALKADVQMPSAADLQPILNNSNPLYIRSGNPSLQASRSLNANFNYNTFNSATNTLLTINGLYTQYWRGFSTSSSVDTNGIARTFPINVTGNYLVSGGINLGLSPKINGLKINAGVSSNYSHTVNLINDQINDLSRISGSIIMGINYDNKYYQLGVRLAPTFNNAKNSYTKLADQRYLSFDNSLNVSLNISKNFRLFSEVAQNLYRGQPGGSDITYYLWNAGLEQYLLHKRNLTIGLNAYDLLGQNAAVTRFITSTGQIQNTQTNTLSRYIYLKVIYKISKVGK